MELHQIKELNHLLNMIPGKLPVEIRANWPLRVTRATRPNTDFSQVIDRWILWLLADASHGVINGLKDHQRERVGVVVNLYKRRIAGDEPSINEWIKAGDTLFRSISGTAGETACWAAERASGFISYRLDGVLYEAACRTADAAANCAADDLAGWRTHWVYSSNQLLILIAEAPIYHERHPSPATKPR